MTQRIARLDLLGPAYGALVLRVTLGVALVAHSLYLKVFVFTMAGTVQYFEGLGLPGALAWVVVLLESFGGAALVLGIAVRPAALALVPVLLGATWVHSPNGWLFENAGGGWEYPVFWALALVTQSLLGPGALAVTIGGAGAAPNEGALSGRTLAARR